MTQNNRDNSIYDSPDFRPFTRDEIFMNVMRSPKICRALLELILPNEEIGAIRLKKSDNPLIDNSEIDEGADENLSVETQKTLKLETDAHGVRFDAFVASSKLWADIEMQTDNDSKIDKRARYYHANMDLDFLEQGQSYENLKPSYVIFICMKDPFERGEAIYQFQMIDKNLQLQLDDETYTIILAINCPKGKIPKELETFFTYVEREEVDENDDFVKRIHEKVEEVNRDTEVTEIMTIEEEMNIRWHYGYDEGEAAGAAQKQREIAKNMKEKNIPNADIAEITGLSAEEVKKL